jgi:hypothetical protein
MPPMLMIAALGSAYGMHEMWELILGPQMAFPLQGLTWLTWFAIGLIATCTIARRGVTHLWQLGFWGLTRPRWWFEAARLALLLSLFDVFILLFAISVVPNGARGRLADTTTIAYFSLGPLVVSWVVAASVGYVLAWLRWRAPRGKAFDCVHYFYVISVGIWLATSGVLMFEAQGPWLVQVFAVGIGGIGVLLLVFGFISIVKRWEKHDRSASP